MGANVICGEKQVRDACDGLGPQRPGIDEIDQQRLFIRVAVIVAQLNIGIEEPLVEVFVFEDFDPVAIEAALELLLDL